ncbi:type I-C CRISPR-associated protein Cas8c/Csd1 [Methylotuvimicrobium buryatense]|uniref:Type I-C CRISPR-associated protein Cas8c/Csd1 n=1 Tax=Methylotuvimicrobium buryatense TaxID=95641 RepID=A0A4P9UQ47_METBY|nr:type I-C CRISPR-associated protein Cas8c/Csd1 [Methylotuvimicrobium buryatense]QCW82683.1 type I-C CRISPR-associated protein Cas8c/Csd1 [Methylotuvimicrobium buryatense]
MSWMEKLYQTYEQGSHLETFKAWPISHFVKTAHIEVVIDGNGNLKNDRIKLLSGEETLTLIPVTESSAGRSGTKIAPHPLCDELGYCAADLPERKHEKNQMFMNQLKTWCLSDYTHPKVQAIYRYLEQQSLWLDITRVIEFPLSFTNRSGQKTKVSADKAFVRWRVEEPGNPCSATWDDQELIEKWIQYDRANHQDEGVCYVSGACARLIQNHSRFLRNSADGAKLISSNDDSGFTFRGRFLEDGEACGISFDISQKAHNALRWLISRQGYRNGDQVYVAWAVSGKPIPEPLADTWSFLNTGDFDLEEVDQAEAPEQTDDTVDHSIDLGQSYAQQLSKKMAGYRAELTANEQIVVMGIDSATPGRMGILYYRELFRDDFFNRLESWHTEFSWPQRHTLEIPNDTGRKPKTKVIWPVSSPVPIAIAKAAYGEKVTDNLKKKVIERLVPCIVDGQPFPWDLVDNCIRKATNRNAYASDGQWLWEKNLAIACALFKGYYRRHPNSNQRRNYAMALEENNRSRDYLYGRLLAIAERIEEVALNVGGENRSTTAARLMQRFADRPYETWRSIELALQPYIQRLRVSRAGFLTNRQKELDAVIALFNGEDFRSKAPLSGEFLLAYHCQRQKFKTKTDTHEPNETEAQGDSE